MIFWCRSFHEGIYSLKTVYFVWADLKKTKQMTSAYFTDRQSLLLVWRRKALISSLRGDDSFNVIQRKCSSWTTSIKTRKASIPHFNIAIEDDYKECKEDYTVFKNTFCQWFLHRELCMCVKIIASHSKWYLGQNLPVCKTLFLALKLL